MSRIYQKCKPVKDPKFYKKWAEDHPRCQCCGIGETAARRRDGGVPISTHHIVKFKRSDEACNLLRLCNRCHQLAEGIRQVEGDLLPKLTLGVCLTIKMMRDAEAYDPERLAQLRGCALPDPEPIPDFLQAEFLARS